MIITLKGANFSSSNIGTLSTWTIFTTLGSGATYSGNKTVDKNAAFSGTVTIADGYELGAAGVTVTMGGTDISSSAVTVSGSTITISIASVTGTVYITVPTVNSSTGEEDGGNDSEGVQRITAHKKAVAIPDGSTSETNLFSVIDYIDYTYDNSNSAYVAATGNLNSISIPVVEGDRIVWTAIKESNSNGGTMNGIRYTLFLDDTKVNSIAPADAYSEYAANGYITIPSGVNCINIPVWNDTYDNECYLLTLSANDTSKIGLTPITGNRTTTNSHATDLPTSVTSSTNLIGILDQVDGSYYTGTGWGTATNISSITFPVLAGDKISGNVFGTKSENGSTVNGTRTTFLSGDTIVQSKTPADIYTEYSANGYVTVPSGCDCISIPFTTSAVSTHNLNVYLLTI